MSRLLNRGDILSGEDGNTYRIEEFIASGGQGEVYKAYSNNHKYAVKWYYPNCAVKEQENIISKIIDNGAPDDRFLWPQEILRKNGNVGFGYSMELRSREYKNIVDLMKRKVEPNFDVLINSCIQLCEGFMNLHMKKLCYRDISFGNVFFRPDTGEVLICDNDNVTLDGKNKSGVLGTPRFMAPEVVTGRSKPDIKSDLFSLSVLLFYMLFMHHPLEGKKEAEIKCFDLPAMTKLYGKNPIFIFDPKNNSNRPVEGLHDNAIIYWNLYPSFIKNMFTRAFTTGLINRKLRIRETEWRYELIKLKDSIMICDKCRSENFYDLFKMKYNHGDLGRCWSCGEKLKTPMRMKIGKDIVMLNEGTKLYLHHISGFRKYNTKDVMGVVERHPVDKNKRAIQNKSEITWVIEYQNGVKKMVEPKRHFRLEDRMKIKFAEVEAEIRK